MRLDLEALGSTDWRQRRDAVEALAGGHDLADQLVAVVASSAGDLGRFNAALQALQQLDPAESLPALEPLIAHHDPEVRTACAVLLTQVHSPLAEPWVVRLLGDADPNVVWQALEAVGRQGLRGASPRVLALALGDQEALAFAALEVVGELDDLELIVPLAGLLHRSDRAELAAAALGRLDHPAALAPLLDWVARDADALFSALEPLDRLARGSAWFGQLCSPAVRRRLLDRCGEAPGREDAARLARLLSGLALDGDGVSALQSLWPTPGVAPLTVGALRLAPAVDWKFLQGELKGDNRPAALDVLAARTEPEAAAALLQAHQQGVPGALSALGNSPQMECAQRLLQSLPLLSPEELDELSGCRPALRVEQLTELLHDAKPSLRRLAARWLRGQAEGAVWLAGALEDPDRDVRRQAVLSLDGLRLPVEALQRAYSEGPAAVRAAVAQLLSQMPHVPAALELAALALQERDLWTPLHALRFLAPLGSSEWLARVEPLLHSPLPPLRAEAVRCWGALGGELSRVTTALNDSHREVRLAALDTLGRRGTQEALPWLLTASTAADVETHHTALAALAGHRSAAASAALRNALGHPGDVEVALTALSEQPQPEALEALLSCLGTSLARSARGRLLARPAFADWCRLLTPADDSAAGRDALRLLARLGQQEQWRQLLPLLPEGSVATALLSLAGAGRVDWLNHLLTLRSGLSDHPAAALALSLAA